MCVYRCISENIFDFKLPAFEHHIILTYYNLSRSLTRLVDYGTTTSGDEVCLLAYFFSSYCTFSTITVCTLWVVTDMNPIYCLNVTFFLTAVFFFWFLYRTLLAIVECVQYSYLVGVFTACILYIRNSSTTNRFFPHNFKSLQNSVSNLGRRVILEVSVTNNGSSTDPFAELTISFPVGTSSVGPHFYVFHIRVPDSTVVCSSDNFIVNRDNLTFTSTSSRRRRCVYVCACACVCGVCVLGEG